MRYITFKKFKKRSGSLVPISLKKDIPFKTKRIFLIYGNKNFIRGNHAHKKCSQFLVPILGKIELTLTTKSLNKKIILDSMGKKGILLKPLTWCKLRFITKNAVIMVFCDREYEFKDYIEKYKDFLKTINKKNSETDNYWMLWSHWILHN